MLSLRFSARGALRDQQRAQPETGAPSNISLAAGYGWSEPRVPAARAFAAGTQGAASEQEIVHLSAEARHAHERDRLAACCGELCI